MDMSAVSHRSSYCECYAYDKDTVIVTLKTAKDVDEAYIAVQGIQITKDMLTMMASNTVKITLPNNIAMIKFRMPDEEYNKLYSENGYVEINTICRANRNEWNGNVTPQLLIEDFEIVRSCAYIF